MFPAPSNAAPAGVIPLKKLLVVGEIFVVVPFVDEALSNANTDPVTGPLSATIAVEGAAEPPLGVNDTLTVRVAERKPAAVGVDVTGTLQSNELSPFCAPHVAVPTVASDVVVSAAVGEETVPAVASEMCTWKFWITVVPSVRGVNPCAKTLRTSIPVALLEASNK